MLGAVLISSFVILIMEGWPLITGEKKDWRSILIILSFLGFAVLSTGLIELNLTEVPGLSDILTFFFKLIFPAFYEFMKP
ncbi:MAG: hypothetical protein ACOWWO_19495 [Peptococcaceae bacterium]